jgi:hypothetical protein
MTDVLIRDVPEEVIAAIDDHARRLGVSRSEYLRRTLARERRAPSPVAVADLQRLAEQFADLDDPNVMGDAWR